MLRRRCHTIAALAVAASMLFAVTACTTDADPAPTDTGTPVAAPEPTETPAATVELPYVTAAPTSQEEAFEYALEALDRYHQLEGEIYGHPEDTSGIELIAQGRALQQVQRSAQSIVDINGVGTGRMEFEIDSIRSYTAPSTDGQDAVAEFGTATLAGCLDRSALAGTSGSGEPFTQPEITRYRATIIVTFAPVTGAWLVTDRSADDGERVEC